MLTPEFRDALSEFSAANVEFLVVGAYAMAAHGLPRATGDIDIWVRRSPKNAQRVWNALASFGAPLGDVSPSDFLKPDLIFQVGIAPQRIDVLTDIDGVQFDDAWPNHQVIQFSGIDVPVISRPDLIKNKRASARPKDLGDLAWLEATESSL